MHVLKKFDVENGTLLRYHGVDPEVTVPENVTDIAAWAFKNKFMLKKITVHGKVTHIDPRAFEGCISLTSVSVQQSNPNYRTVNGDLYTKNGEELLYYAAGNPNESFTVPPGVKTVGEGAFLSSPNLKTVTVPDGVTAIGRLAFADCPSLVHVSIPDTVTSIGVGAFTMCSALKTVILPEGVTTIGLSAFHGCLSLEELSIPESVTKIGVKAFSGIPKTATLHLKWEFISILESKELLEEWGCAIRGFLKRYYLTGLRASDGDNWTAYLKKHAAKSLRVLPNEPLLYRFLTENNILSTSTANAHLTKTEDPECRAVLLNYLNGRKPKKQSSEGLIEQRFKL